MIVIDCETLVDPAYFGELGRAVYDGGFRPVLYGSAAFVTSNPSPYGYFPADYNYTHPPTILPANWHGLQWKPGQAWDLDIFDADMLAGCGTGPRK